MMQLRDYQQDAINALYDYWRSKQGRNPIISACVGAGKSLLIAKIIKDSIDAYSKTRVLMLTHLAELIEQNADELKRFYHDADIGFYSAGLKKRDMEHSIIFAGIQSIAKQITRFDPFHMVIIDEAHMVPKNTSTLYGKTLAALKAMNPDLVVIGMSGTPYRLDGGLLVEGDDRIFDGVAYEIGIADLVRKGYLVPPITKQMLSQIDTNGIKKQKGEFNQVQLAQAAEKTQLVKDSVSEILDAASDRHSIIVFAVSVHHGEMIRDELKARGEQAELITGDLDKLTRDYYVDEYKQGRLRFLININTMVAGFNAPRTDCVAILRATASAAFFVQACGRGLRLFEGKANCLILDFGGNFERFGPLDTITVKSKKAKKDKVAKMLKECPNCAAHIHISARECPDCGYEFPARDFDHETTAYDGAALSEQIKPIVIDVDRVTYSRHRKMGAPDSVKVSYWSGLNIYHEWICPEHQGYAGTKGRAEIKARNGMAENTSDALNEAPNWKRPIQITVLPDGKYHKITKRVYP